MQEKDGALNRHGDGTRLADEFNDFNIFKIG